MRSVPSRTRVPPGARLDVEPLRVLAKPHRRGQRDSESVGEELDRDVEQLLLVVHLEREAPEVGHDRLLALPEPELLEPGPGLVDVDAQARVAEERAVARPPRDAVVQHPAELAVGPAQPVLHRERLLALEGLGRELEAPIDVVRVHRGGPTVAQLLGQRTAGELEPAVVAPGVPTVRAGCPQQQGDAVGRRFEAGIGKRGRTGCPPSATLPIPDAAHDPGLLYPAP